MPLGESHNSICSISRNWLHAVLVGVNLHTLKSIRLPINHEISMERKSPIELQTLLEKGPGGDGPKRAAARYINLPGRAY